MLSCLYSATSGRIKVSDVSGEIKSCFLTTTPESTRQFSYEWQSIFSM